MKKIFSFLLIIVFLTNCKAQILDISQDAGTGTATGTYYKDTQNLLDPFQGVYVYTDGTTTFKLVLQKKVMANVANGRYTQDLIIGEYQYINNGVELANTLNKLTASINNAWKYTLDGNRIITGQSLGCDDCSSTERRLRLGIVDDATDNYGEVEIRKVLVNGQPAIKLWIAWQPQGIKEGEDAPAMPALPDGEYIMLLQY